MSEGARRTRNGIRKETRGKMKGKVEGTEGRKGRMQEF